MTDLHPGFGEAFAIARSSRQGPDHLYEKWWSGIADGTTHEGLPSTPHPDVKSRIVSRGIGYEIHSTGGSVLRVLMGEMVHTGNQRAIIRRWKSWSSDTFAWRQSLALPRFPRGKNLLRAYIPTQDLQSKHIATGIADALDTERVFFQLKFRRNGGVFRDSIVIWFDPSDIAEVSSSIKDWLAKSQPLTSPPPLTLCFDGIGLSEQPVDGGSVGWMYSCLLWSLAAVTTEDQLAPTLSLLGGDPLHPWRIQGNESMNWERTVS